MTDDSTARYLLFWFGVLVTLLGMPALAAFLVRLLVPGAEDVPRKQAAIGVASVVVVMAAANLLRTQHPHMLSCDDVTISGNVAPADCNPGVAITESGAP
jgi:hypothetical protein